MAFIHQDVPGAGAFCGAYDAEALHVVHEAAGAGVADAEAALQSGYGRPLGVKDPLGGFSEKFVFFLFHVLRIIRFFGNGKVDGFVGHYGFLFQTFISDIIHYVFYFLIGNEGALDADGAQGPRLLEEHIPFAQEGFGAAFV